MFEFLCDRCKAPIDPSSQARYVVRIEVHRVCRRSLDADGQTCEDDIDPLSELYLRLEEHGMQDEHAAESLAASEHQEPANHHAQYELCSRCYHRFSVDPLGRDVAQALHFSQN